jgi:hypothetical protein
LRVSACIKKFKENGRVREKSFAINFLNRASPAPKNKATWLKN